MAQVSVDLISDAKEVSRAINQTIREISLMGRAIDVNNDIAVKTWKNAAEAAHQYLNAVSATHEQQLRLAVATRTTEDRIEAMGERFARAGERGERALSNLMRTGELTGRSMNNLMNAAGDLGFAFGPEGAIAAGVGMMAMAVVQHMVSAKDKVEELAHKFDENMADMLANSSAVEMARKSADAYIHELEIGARRISDARKGSVRNLLSGDLTEAVPAFMRLHGEADDPNLARNDGAAADKAAQFVARIEQNNKELERLKNERKQVNDDIAHLTVHLRELKKDGADNERAGAEHDIVAAQAKLAQLEKRTRELEELRLLRLNQAIVGAPNQIEQAALVKRSAQYAPTDLGLEHSQRDFESGRGMDATKAGAQADAAFAKQLERAKAQGSLAEKLAFDAFERQHKAEEEHEKLQAKVTEDAIKGIGLKDVAEAMAINAEHDRRVAEIEDLKIYAATKQQLIEDANQLQIAELAALNNKIEGENARHDREQKKHDDEAARKQTEAVKKKTDIIAHAEGHAIDALIAGHKDAGRKILKALLEPEVKHLEGLAAKHLYKSAAEFAALDFAGGARDAAAAALYTGGAAAVASIGGGGGGGGGGSGGGGGGGAGTGGLGASLATGTHADQPLKIEFVMIQKDQSGREVARTRQIIQRLDDQNMPIRVTL